MSEQPPELRLTYAEWERLSGYAPPLSSLLSGVTAEAFVRDLNANLDRLRVTLNRQWQEIVRMREILEIPPPQPPPTT